MQLHLSEEETRQCAAAWSTRADDAGSTADLSEHTAKLEDELESVEEEERRLQARLEQTGKILDMMMRRETILEKRAEMQANAKDPSRLLGRKAAGALLAEEKLRNSIKKLPDMNNRLRELCKEWSETHGEGQPLTYDGVALVDILSRQEEEDKVAEAEEKRLAAEAKRLKEEEKLAAKQNAAAAARGGAPAPRTSRAVPSAAAGARAGAVPKGWERSRPRQRWARWARPPSRRSVRRTGAAVGGAATAAWPPRPRPVHAQPTEIVRQTLAAAQGNTPTKPSTPTKRGAAAAPPANSLPVVN